MSVGGSVDLCVYMPLSLCVSLCVRVCIWLSHSPVVCRSVFLSSFVNIYMCACVVCLYVCRLVS